VTRFAIWQWNWSPKDPELLFGIDHRGSPQMELLLYCGLSLSMDLVDAQGSGEESRGGGGVERWSKVVARGTAEAVVAAA
jgi:hypothetical protein